MIKARRTVKPIGVVTHKGGKQVAVYGTVWVDTTPPRPHNPLHPLAQAAIARRAKRAALALRHKQG